VITITDIPIAMPENEDLINRGRSPSPESDLDAAPKLFPALLDNLNDTAGVTSPQSGPKRSINNTKSLFVNTLKVSHYS
jgi:hypothetical protein